MNKITSLLGIQYPIIQAGMVWCSGWRLASAASNNGALGVLGAGSMYPDVLREHIQKCKNATQNPFAVNIPLFYPQIEELFEILFEEGVKVVITSGGDPALYTQKMKKLGITVLHVIANTKFAKKAEDAGVDAVIAEGFEAGGHNGRDETTTMCLVPSIVQYVSIPVVAAGGIASGETMLAAMSLGADGVQIGSRFAISKESSAHELFKSYVVNSKDGDTILTLKELAPVRMLKNDFYKQVVALYQKGTSKEELSKLLGRGRIKKGIFEGDVQEGNLEIGQISAIIHSVESVEDIIQKIIADYELAKSNLFSFHD
ncbi:MAG: nitronate monooxygenase [Flavobacteriales bacterium]|nr:nitronate monooxygenase [Flavobacteriales bacterium]